MKRLFRVTVSLWIMVGAASSASSQELVLKNRSVIELNLGVWGGSKVSNTIGVSGVRATADASSFVGGLLYAYGIRENAAVTLSAGVLGAAASANVSLLGVSQETGTVVPLLLGLRYYVPYPESGARVRPFLSLGVGTYLGFESGNSIGVTVTQESRTESAYGGRIGAGIDFYLSNYFKFVASAGYNAMSDFSSPITGRMNFNGGDFSVGAGYAF